MKKSLVLVILLILMLSAPLMGSDRVDMIVLLDNSISVLPYYDEIQNSLLGRIVSEHLAPGDSFSLITFADGPEVEVSREIKNRDDIENILAYSTLLQPMGSHTDLIMALRFLYKYTLDLPLNNRKKIVILTDGIHDPAEDSPYYHISADEVRKEIEKAADDIHRQGWDVSIVELEDESALPGFESAESDAAEQSGQSAAGGDTIAEAESSVDSVGEPENEDHSVDVIDTVSEGIGSTPSPFDTEEDDMAGIALGTPLVSVPEHLGTTSGILSVPLTVQNRDNKAILFSLSEIISSGADVLKSKKSVEIKAGGTAELKIELILPDGLAEGEQQIKIRPVLIDGERISPELIDLKFKYEVKSGIAGGADFLLDWKIITIIAAVILAVVIILIIRKTGSRERSKTTLLVEERDEVVRTIAANGNEAEKDDLVFELKDDGKAIGMMSMINPDTDNDINITKKNRPIHMFVFGQNTKSGVTNVKWLGINKKRPVGSSSNAFFRIFFVKVPNVLAEIECTEDDFIFYPKADEYFPEIDGPLHSCLNKKIRVVTPEEKIFFIEFRQWVSKLEKLNRLLAMTKTAGKPDMDF